MGASKANSGIVHAGFDAPEGSLKAKFNLLGNLMMEEYAKELGVKYINNGSLVVAFSEEERVALENLRKRGEKNGVGGLDIIDKDELSALDDILSKKVIRKLETQNPIYLKSSAQGLKNYLDELFGKDMMPLCKERIQKMERNA